jgi:hypothetical protein
MSTAIKAIRPLTETEIQRAVFEHINVRGKPGLLAFHCPNGGYRRPTEAAIFKGMGVKAGVADVLCLYQTRFYALELKAEGGRLTELQMQFLMQVEKAGGFASTAQGLDKALEVLEGWGLLRGES